MRFSLILVALLLTVDADIYFHNPRGSNNRLDENGRERRNANRLFDSQNNNRGGYNVGSLYYYVGSKLAIEWTNQHSCNSPNNHCELIIQYMCGDMLRDGATTSTIPDNLMQCKNYDCNSDTEYGMHEDYDYYMNCKLRQRNKGLFTADQNLHGRERAKNTRQNPGGTRRGYECPEERDYYPYWHPTPWRDIAVLTNDATRCPYYQEESENVKGRWACVLPRDLMMKNQFMVPNNKKDCEEFRWPKNDQNGTRGEWVQFPSHNQAEPLCQETEFTRDNHLGNGIGGYPNLFNWTVPDTPHERCVMRIRYNISTADYEAWESVNASHNSKQHGHGAQLPLAERYGFQSEDEAKDRGYQFKNNPEVKVFDGINLKLRLAINTAQFGRTFQDRSHTFAIRSRPEELKGATIHNLNVRGKRGNIVQVYPGVEYDFVPNTLEASKDDYIHFQWTGSNTNPHNNDGQGRAGTDRSNVVLQRAQAYSEGTGSFYRESAKVGHWGRSYPESLKNASFLGFSKEDMMNLALLQNHQFRGEMSELDDAGTYFDLKPKKITAEGIYHFLSTRNNNFSNRSQKGKIIVIRQKKTEKSIGWNGGEADLQNKLKVKVERGTFDKLQKLRMEEWVVDDGQKKIQSVGRTPPDGDYASNFLVINPSDKITSGNKKFTIEAEIEPGSPGSTVNLYRADTASFAAWTVMDCEINENKARCQTDRGGTFVAIRDSKVPMIVGIIVAVAVLATIIAGTAVYCRRNPAKWNSFRGGFRQAARSMQSKV